MPHLFTDASAPVELVLQVLDLCDSPADAFALAFSCRRTWAIWDTEHYGTELVWRHWLEDTACLDEALIAARATQLVYEAELRNELPPKNIPLASLGYTVSKPTGVELSAVCNLMRLARALETDFVDVKDDLLQPDWLHQALFRYVAIAAAIAAAYHEPFYEAQQSSDDEIRAIADLQFNAEDDYDDKNGCYICRTSDAQQDFIRAFPVFQMIPMREYDEPSFMPIAQWLYESISRKAKTQHNEAESTVTEGTVPVGFESRNDDDFAVAEVLRVLFIGETLLKILLDTQDHEHREGMSIAMAPRAPLLVLMDSFTTTRLRFAIQSSPRELFLRDEAATSARERPELKKLLNWWYTNAGEVNASQDDEGWVWLLGPPRVKFFHYCLRELFGVRFHHELFDEGHLENRLLWNHMSIRHDLFHVNYNYGQEDSVTSIATSGPDLNEYLSEWIW